MISAHKQTSQTHANGFTLIELLLTLSIVIVIGTFSTSFFSNFLTQNALVNTQDQFIGLLRKAQLYSMIGKNGAQWGVHYGSNKLTLFRGASYASRITSSDETYDINGNITVTGITDMVFTKISGIPDTSGTVTISGNNGIKTITINSQGVASR